MTLEKSGALALILGSIAGITLMAMHPTHADAGPMLGAFTLNQVVHGTAMVAAPVLTFGAYVLARVMGLERPLPVLGLVFYLFGALVILIAAAMSGFIMPEIIEAAHTPGAAETGVDFQGLANITHWINQTFANMHTSFVALALLSWAIAWRKGWVMKILGLVIALGQLAWQLSGTLTLNIHGMGAIVLLQAIWMISAGVLLWRGKVSG